jgi:hypothetical protein
VWRLRPSRLELVRAKLARELERKRRKGAKASRDGRRAAWRRGNRKAYQQRFASPAPAPDAEEIEYARLVAIRKMGGPDATNLSSLAERRRALTLTEIGRSANVARILV